MNSYSSVTRAKIVVWTVVMVIILAGSSVLGAWDKGIIIKPEKVQQAIASGSVLSGSVATGEVMSGVVQSGELTTDLVYLNDTQYVDLAKVRDTRLTWTNELRSELGRDPYTTDWRLNATASAWSQHSASIGSISHKRKSSDGYYNYNGLVQWFKWKGEELTGSPIVFRNVSRATFSESIGRGMWSCREADCTDEVIEATRSTWNFFYRERAANGVHYRALTHKLFKIQGLGVAFSGKKYYLTIHYGTQILE